MQRGRHLADGELKRLVATVLLAVAATPAAGADARSPTADGAEIARLVRDLGSDDWAERERATTRLIAIGKPAHDALRAALTSQDAEVRYRARLVLRASLRSVKKLLDALARGGSRDEHAIQELVAMGGEAIDPLVYVIGRELADYEGKNDQRVIIAFEALEKIASPRSVEPILSLLELNLQHFQVPLAKAMLASGEAAARDALRTRIHSADPLVRRNAVELLGLFRGSSVAAALADGLSDPDPTVRAEAVRALERVARRALRAARMEGRSSLLGTTLTAEAAAAMLRAMDDPDRQVELRAMGALAELGEKRVLPRLRTLVSEKVADDRLPAAVKALAVLGDRESVPLLLPLLESDRTDVLVESAAALGALKAREAVKGLTAILERDEPQVHAVVIRALGMIGDRQAFPALRVYYLNRRYFVPLALEAIGRLPGREAREFLVERVKVAKDEAELKVALERLDDRADEPDELGSDEAVAEAALSILERSPARELHNVRLDAIRLVRKWRVQAAEEDLLRCLEDEGPNADPNVRRRAIEALGDLGDRRAVEPLTHLLERSADDKELTFLVLVARARLGCLDGIDAAIAAARDDLKKSPGDSGVATNLGILHLCKKDWASAESAFKGILAFDKRNQLAAYNLACTCSLAGRLAEAGDWLRKAGRWRSDVSGELWKDMEADSDLDAIRASAAYGEALSTMRAQSGERRGRGEASADVDLVPGAADDESGAVEEDH